MGQEIAAVLSNDAGIVAMVAEQADVMKDVTATTFAKAKVVVSLIGKVVSLTGVGVIVQHIVDHLSFWSGFLTGNCHICRVGHYRFFATYCRNRS